MFTLGAKVESLTTSQWKLRASPASSCAHLSGQGSGRPVNTFSGEAEGGRDTALIWGQSMDQAAGDWSVTCGRDGGTAGTGREPPSTLHHPRLKQGWPPNGSELQEVAVVPPSHGS